MSMNAGFWRPDIITLRPRLMKCKFFSPRTSSAACRYAEYVDCLNTKKSWGHRLKGAASSYDLYDDDGESRNYSLNDSLRPSVFPKTEYRKQKAAPRRNFMQSCTNTVCVLFNVHLFIYLSRKRRAIHLPASAFRGKNHGSRNTFREIIMALVQTHSEREL